ncbi:MAG: proline/glycine betaine ABC transporter permease, partial [Desulfobacterales bacterium]
MEQYRIPLGKAIESFIDFLVDNLSFATKAFSNLTETGIDIIISVLMYPPPIVVIVIATGLAWYISKSWRIGLFTALGLLLIWNMQLWGATMSTVTLIMISTLIAVGFGIPIGILAALSQIVYKIVTPILDVMQTMPAFVYLIPAI